MIMFSRLAISDWFWTIFTTTIMMMFSFRIVSAINGSYQFDSSGQQPTIYSTSSRDMGGGYSGVTPNDSYHSWSVMDWWQENLREDFYDLFTKRPNLPTNMDLFYEKRSDPNQNSERSTPSIQRRHDQVDNDDEFDDLNTSESETKKSVAIDDGDDEKQTDGDDEMIGKNHHKSLPIKVQPTTTTTAQQQQQSIYVPTSSLSSIKSMFYEFFSQIRSNLYDQDFYLTLKRNLRAKFLDYGLQTAIQSFHHPKRNDRGHNIVGIYPGKYRDRKTKSSSDSVLVIGAHYDTVPESPGVEDNGSGSVAVLELARLLHKYRCRLNTTIIFVLFDMEEDGLIGSKNFVKNYLIPVEKERNRVPIHGAIIMDMLLEYDTSVGSQYTDGIGAVLPEWNKNVQRNRYRGDFTAVWSRRDVDAPLFNILDSSWLNRQKYKLFLMDPPLPRLGRDLTKPKLYPYRTFMRSDHSSFWYPHHFKNQTINAILLTDLGPWRRKVSNKYHSSFDNSKLLNRENLLYLKNSIDSIMDAIMILGNGKCKDQPQ